MHHHIIFVSEYVDCKLGCYMKNLGSSGEDSPETAILILTVMVIAEEQL